MKRNHKIIQNCHNTQFSKETAWHFVYILPEQLKVYTEIVHTLIPFSIHVHRQVKPFTSMPSLSQRKEPLRRGPASLKMRLEPFRQMPRIYNKASKMKKSISQIY